MYAIATSLNFFNSSEKFFTAKVLPVVERIGRIAGRILLAAFMVVCGYFFPAATLVGFTAYWLFPDKVMNALETILGLFRYSGFAGSRCLSFLYYFLSLPATVIIAAAASGVALNILLAPGGTWLLDRFLG